MSDNRSTRVLIGVVFLVAAGLLAINNLVQSVPLGDWWLVAVLAAVGIGFLIWPQAETAARPTAQAQPTTKLPKEPDSLQEQRPQKEQRAEIMEAPPAKIMEAPPKKVVVAEEPAKKEPVAPPAPKPEPVKAEPASKDAPAVQPDELTRVEGIGPKYHDVLVAAGIDTFSKLAGKSQADLEAVIKAAGMRKPASITTWAEQAGLAAKGDWDGLKKLQDGLTGGRKA